MQSVSAERLFDQIMHLFDQIRRALGVFVRKRCTPGVCGKEGGSGCQEQPLIRGDAPSAAEPALPSAAAPQIRGCLNPPGILALGVPKCSVLMAQTMGRLQSSRGSAAPPLGGEEEENFWVCGGQICTQDQPRGTGMSGHRRGLATQTGLCLATSWVWRDEERGRYGGIMVFIRAMFSPAQLAQV